MEIYVKNGAPPDGASLCETCTYGFMARGYRETEMLVVCTQLYPERQLHFQVRNCSGYVEKNRPLMKQMEDIAIVLDRSDLKREAGFMKLDARGRCAESAGLISDGDNK